MLHTTNPIIKHKAGLLNLPEELCNVSQACRVMGVSRDTFYRYQEAVDNGGIDSLLNANHRAPNIKNRVDQTTEIAVVKYATDTTHGPMLLKGLRLKRKCLIGRLAGLLVLR